MSNNYKSNFFKDLAAQGWVLDRSGKHPKLRHKLYGMVSFSNSPSCPYWHKHLLGDIKRKVKEYESKQTTKPT